MAADFSVNVKRIRDAAQDLERQNRDFHKRANDLESARRALDGKWDGDSNDAFNRAFRDDKQYMDQFHRVIEEYWRLLLQIADEYEKAERRASQIATQRSAKK